MLSLHPFCHFISVFLSSLSFAATFNIDEKLRQDELEAFKQAFDMFDKNSDGTISTKVRMEAAAHSSCADMSLWNRRHFYVDSKANKLSTPLCMDRHNGSGPGRKKYR